MTAAFLQSHLPVTQRQVAGITAAPEPPADLRGAPLCRQADPGAGALCLTDEGVPGAERNMWRVTQGRTSSEAEQKTVSSTASSILAASSGSSQPPGSQSRLSRTWLKPDSLSDVMSPALQLPLSFLTVTYAGLSPPGRVRKGGLGRPEAQGRPASQSAACQILGLPQPICHLEKEASS